MLIYGQWRGRWGWYEDRRNYFRALHCGQPLLSRRERSGSPEVSGADMIDLRHGDVLECLSAIESDSIDCCVTSPPYWGLRDYGVDGQIGLEPTPSEFVAKMVAVFSEVRRVLKPTGTCWVNLGDSYATGAGKVGSYPGGGEQGAAWAGYRGTRGESPKHSAGSVGPMTQPNRMPQSGLKPKDLVGIPWRVAFALQDSGWWLRQDIIWHKPNPMPESVRDRCTKAHEYIFLLTKSERYTYDHTAIMEPFIADHQAGNKTHKGKDAYDAGDEKHRTKQGLVAYAQKSSPPSYKGSDFNRGKSSDGKEQTGAKVGEAPRVEAQGRNKRSVWTISTQPTPEAHFATFPLELPETCILAGCPEGGTVLDPFSGAGTTGLAALKHGRNYIGIELNQDYIEITRKRLQKHNPLFGITS